MKDIQHTANSSLEPSYQKQKQNLRFAIGQTGRQISNWDPKEHSQTHQTWNSKQIGINLCDRWIRFIGTFTRKSRISRNMWSRIALDKIIANQLTKVREKWESTLSHQIKVPQSIPLPHSVLTVINIHVFANSRIIGTCATANAVIYQPGHVNQYVIASKYWLAKQNLSIPRLELIAVHIASNFSNNIQTALTSYDIYIGFN